MPSLHILCNPNATVHINNRTDPFSIAVIKFANNMTELGWNCIIYAIPGSEANVEVVNCLPFKTIGTHQNVVTYNTIAGSEISRRKKPGDLIMCFHGWENKAAAEANSDLRIVEPSIGYDVKAVFAPYRVFTSYAQMHMFYGLKDMLMTPSWFDAVIPNAFTPSEFEYNENKKDYILYFGRVIESKGIHIAIQATKETGNKLVIAGPGNLADLGYAEIPQHVEYVGVCDAEKRKQLMSEAKAIIGPTYYVEPFGNMVAEGYFSGTPAITSDWGGFVDTVVHGKTGYRCKEFSEFVTAIESIDKIKHIDCYEFAMNNFSELVVHQKFNDYCNKVIQSNFYR